MAKQKKSKKKDTESSASLQTFLDIMPELADIPDWENDPELLRDLGFRDGAPDEAEIEEQQRHLIERQRQFVVAAEWVARELTAFPWVRRIVLFGSVANPLKEEVPRFRDFRRWNIKLPHECGDADIAVWLDEFTDLRAAQKAKNRALDAMARAEGFHVAPHQVDMFLHESANGAYIGRLCQFNTCPKGKPECLNEECGRIPFLKFVPGFAMRADALTPGRSRTLFDRSAGTMV